MSNLMKFLQFGYLSNNEKEDFFFSDDEDDFNFKYISANQFKHIVKDVKRQKIKTNEENAWASFVEQQDVEKLFQHLSENNPKSQNVVRRPFKTVEEMDRELLRLEKDALPEVNKGEYKTLDQEIEGKFHEKNAPFVKDIGTGSTNLLLRIPEEDYLSTIFEKSTEVNQSKTDTRKSSSAPGIGQRRSHSKRLLHAVNDLDFSSSLELSAERLSEREEMMYVRPDPMIAAKILGTQKKISDVLDEIAHRLGRIPLPDGDRDLHRRQQRVLEFSIRFARNYLYDLGRQVAEIRRHVNAISPSFSRKIGRRGVIFHVQAIEQKLVTAHQLLLHALSAYCKHIPSSVLKGHPGKLKEILQIVIDLKDFCEKIHLAPDYFGSGDGEGLPLGKDTDSRCSIILSKLRLSSDESQVVSHTTRSTLATATTPMRSKKRSSRKQVSNRLSMYNIHDSRLLKNHVNRRTRLPQKEKKRNSISSLKINRPLTPDLPHPSPVSYKSKEVAKNGIIKINVPPKEDDIKTMMEIIPIDSDTGSSVGAQRKYDNLCLDQNSKVQRLPASSETFRNSEKHSRYNSLPNEDETTKKVTQITDEHLTNLVPVIADIMSLIRNNTNDSESRELSSVPVDALIEIMQKHQRNKAKNNLNTSVECQFPSSNLRNQNGIRTGSENMQLLCLKSRDDCKVIPKFSDASCQVSKDQSKNKSSNGLMQLGVSNDSELSLLEYRHEFQLMSESHQMYSNHTPNKPWDVVAWIADELVNELIENLAKELQVDEVIKKLFELEFREL